MTIEDVRRILEFPDPNAAPPGGAPCPFLPLGHRDGRFYIIDATGQLREFGPRDLSPLGLIDLCGMPPDSEFPIDAWLVRIAPTLDRNGQPTGEFSAKRAGARVQALCRRAGVFDPQIERRSAGVWLGREDKRAGRLLVHFGDVVEQWDEGQLVSEEPAGFIDADTVYVAAPRRLRRNDLEPFTAVQSMAFVEHLNSWGWRDDAQPDLMAGVAALGFYGQASPWRVHGAISAPSKSGKTELALFIATSLGAMAWYRNEFSEAFIRQTLTGQARVLVLDEAESDSHGGISNAGRAIGLIRRLSGEEGFRGGRGSAGGRPMSYSLSGSGLIFGITIPPLPPADRSRFITFGLTSPRGGVAELERAKAWAVDAADPLRLRMLSLWPMFRAAMPIFASALEADRNFWGRDAKVFGATLAARWLLQYDRLPDLAEAGKWLEHFDAALTEHARDSETTDVDTCLGKLLTSSVRAFRGGDELTIGEICEEAVAAVTIRDQYGIVTEIKPFAVDRAPALWPASRRRARGAASAMARHRQ
jgi:hypothetical protein